MLLLLMAEGCLPDSAPMLVEACMMIAITPGAYCKLSGFLSIEAIGGSVIEVELPASARYRVSSGSDVSEVTSSIR